MRKINTIVIHHSQNRISFNDIKNLHVNEYNWDDIGYHFVIDENGNVLPGRDLDKVGAHVYGYNDDSIGICLIGNFDLSFPNKLQLSSLFKLIHELKIKYGIRDIKGHNEYPNVEKTCPGKNLNVNSIRNLS